MTDPPKPLQTDGLSVDSVDAPETLRRYRIGTRYAAVNGVGENSAAGHIREMLTVSSLRLSGFAQCCPCA